MILEMIQLVALFVIPFYIIKYHKFVITRWVGTIGTAYFLGILVAVMFYTLYLFDVKIQLNSEIGEYISFISIAVAIPLLLFSANLAEVRKLSKVVLKSFLSLVISAIVVSSIVFYFYGKNIEFGAELSAMAIGLYTGGTPNLNALGNIFSLNATTIGIANLSDMVIGAVFYMFLLLGAKPLLSRFLPKSQENLYLKGSSNIENTDEILLEQFVITKKLSMKILLAFGMAVLSAIIGAGIFFLIGDDSRKLTDILVPTLMIGVTVFGIVGSFNKNVRETKGMNVVGQYFILVFSFALASSLDFTQMRGLFQDIIILYGVITLGVFVVHVFISKWMKIDADCTIITLTAGVYGPAFIPAITKQLKNDGLTVPGLIVGSIGYAIGTFLGMLLGLLFLL